MIIRILCTLLALTIVPLTAHADTVTGDKTYDLLFRSGTLDTIDKTKALIYSRAVSNSLKPEAAQRDTGNIALMFRPENVKEAQLEFRQDGKYRRLGKFPASVGNPMIMYFYESTIRDMAEAAGGSPFYIRNRVKDALIQPSDVQDGQFTQDGRSISTKTIHLRPFEDDPNKDQMDGFGDLLLTVTMSEDVPGWYMSLTAKAGDVYHSEVKFLSLENAK